MAEAGGKSATAGTSGAAGSPGSGGVPNTGGAGLGGTGSGGIDAASSGDDDGNQAGGSGGESDGNPVGGSDGAGADTMDGAGQAIDADAYTALQIVQVQVLSGGDCTVPKAPTSIHRSSGTLDLALPDGSAPAYYLPVAVANNLDSSGSTPATEMNNLTLTHFTVELSAPNVEWPSACPATFDTLAVTDLLAPRTTAGSFAQCNHALACTVSSALRDRYALTGHGDHLGQRTTWWNQHHKPSLRLSHRGLRRLPATGLQRSCPQAIPVPGCSSAVLGADRSQSLRRRSLLSTRTGRPNPVLRPTQHDRRNAQGRRRLPWRVYWCIGKRSSIFPSSKGCYICW
jgi:hypothetical protein